MTETLQAEKVEKAEKTAVDTLAGMFEIGDIDGEHVCFVCTGNTCRSPMAQAVLNHFGKPYGITAESAGISVIPGDGIAENSVLALKNAGIEPSEDNPYDKHTARLIDEETVKRSSRVVCMTENHMLALIGAFPQYVGKFTVMPRAVSDPFGGDLARYEACLREIICGVKELFHLDN